MIRVLYALMHDHCVKNTFIVESDCERQEVIPDDPGCCCLN